MNAALIASCAANSVAGSRNGEQPIYILPKEHLHREDRPVLGMIKIHSKPDLVVLDDLANDGVELRFRSVYAVTKLIRDLEALKENMLALE